jgi:hypothetical protein
MAAASKIFSRVNLPLLIFGLVILFLFIWIPMRLAAVIPLEDTDFFTFWLAGKFNWLGMNPHDSQDWTAGHRMFNALEGQDNPTFLYPLPMAVLMAPLGLLTLSQAYILWNFLTLVMLAAGMALLLRTWGKTLAPQYLLPVFAAAPLFRPVIITLFGGQLSGLFFLVIALAALAFERKAWFWAGFLLGLLALKPNIGAPFIILAGLWLLFQTNWRALGGMAAAGASLLLIGLARNLNWVADFLSVSGYKFQETFGFSATIWGIASGTCGFTYTCTLYLGGALAAALVLGSVALLIQRRSPLSPALALSLITCTSLLVTPYLWPYDQTLLILPILAVMSAMLEKKAPFLLTATLFLWLDLLAILLMLVTIQIEMEVWNGFVSLACLGLLGWAIFAQVKRQGAPSPAKSEPGRQ